MNEWKLWLFVNIGQTNVLCSSPYISSKWPSICKTYPMCGQPSVLTSIFVDHHLCELPSLWAIIYVKVDMSGQPSVYYSICLKFHMFGPPSVWNSICLDNHLFECQYVWPTICVPNHLIDLPPVWPQTVNCRLTPKRCLSLVFPPITLSDGLRLPSPADALSR